MIKGINILILVLVEVLYVCQWLMVQFIELELDTLLLLQVDMEEHSNHVHLLIHVLEMEVV